MRTEPMHALDILGFVDAPKIPSEYFATPYRLVPAPGGEQLYALLCEELKRRGKVGIAHVVLQTRPQLAAIVPQGSALMLTTLLWANETERPAPSVEDLLLEAGVALAAPRTCCTADAMTADAGLQALQPEMPALAEYAMTDSENAEFSLEQADELDDDECLEEQCLTSAIRRDRHPRNGYAVRGTKPRSRHMMAARGRSGRRR